VYLDRRYRGEALITKACGVIVGHELSEDLPHGTALIADDPRAAFWHVLALFAGEAPLVPLRHPMASIHPSAVIDPSDRIEAYASVGSGARIDAHVMIGEGARIRAGASVGEGSSVGCNAVVMDDVTIGARVLIGAGTVVGSDGFGFATIDGTQRRMPHVGTVVIEDDVEIGANCTIDRATIGATVLGRACKIDNLVHVAHNVSIGAETMIAAQCGIAGSAAVGAGTLMGGQAGVADHVTIAPESRIGASSAVMKTCGGTVVGSPARPLSEQRRAEAMLRRLSRRSGGAKEGDA